MPKFDVRHPFWVTPEYATSKIQDAWLLQCARPGVLNRWIELFSQGVHSHSAMLTRHVSDGTIDVLEVLQLYGGRRKPIDYYVKHPGRLDIFSPCCDGMYADTFKPQGAVAMMRTLTEYEYGYAGIIQMFLRRMPLICHIYPRLTVDVLPNTPSTKIRQPFCSHAVAMAYQYGGGVDPVPRQPNFLVSPAQLTNSMFFQYEFSLVTAWARQRYAADILAMAELNEALFLAKKSELTGNP